MPTHRLLANGRAPCLALLQTAERLWRVSLVDSWCLTNLSNRTPSPLENEPRRTSSRKPYLRTKLQHLWGRFNWVAAWGVLLRNRRNRSISGYAKDRVRGRGSSSPDKDRCFERVVLEFLIQLPFPPNRVDGWIEQQLENEGSADPTHHRSKSKSLRIFVT